MSPTFSEVDIFCTNAHGIRRWMIGTIFVKFSQLILMKIVNIALRSPDPLAGFKGLTSKVTGRRNW